jgi:hypothetical protein
MSCHTVPTNSDYRPGHSADRTLGTHLITVVAAPTLAVRQTTTADPIVMTDDPTVTIGRIETAGLIGTIDHTETIGRTEKIGRPATIDHIVTIVDAIGMTILTIASGADLAIAPDITVAAGIKTTWRITRAASLLFSCLITVEAGEYTYVLRSWLHLTSLPPQLR